MTGHRQTQPPDIGRVASRQLGLVTAAQLRQAGLSPASVLRRVERGAYQRLGTRVYAVAGAPRTWEQSSLAACLDLGHGAVLSHWSAAAAWQLGVRGERPVHVTVDYGRNARRPRDLVVVHRSRLLGAADRAQAGRLPVTTVARTLVDLASVADPAMVANAVDDALCRRLVSPGRLWSTTARLTRGRRAGTRALRDLLAPWRSAAPLDSVAESAFRRAILAAGLPAPAVQHVVADAAARTDFAWPDRMVVLEVDGFRWHANPAAHASDSRRGNRLAAAGWTVLHATPFELDTALPGIIAALRRQLAATA